MLIRIIKLFFYLLLIIFVTGLYMEPLKTNIVRYITSIIQNFIIHKKFLIQSTNYIHNVGNI